MLARYCAKFQYTNQALPNAPSPLPTCFKTTHQLLLLHALLLNHCTCCKQIRFVTRLLQPRRDSHSIFDVWRVPNRSSTTPRDRE